MTGSDSTSTMFRAATGSRTSMTASRPLAETCRLPPARAPGPPSAGTCRQRPDLCHHPSRVMGGHPPRGHSEAMHESSPRPENEGSAASDGNRPLAIVLAADDAAVRPKLRRLLESAPGLEI